MIENRTLKFRFIIAADIEVREGIDIDHIGEQLRQFLFDEYGDAARRATINALLEAGGIVNLDDIVKHYTIVSE